MNWKRSIAVLLSIAMAVTTAMPSFAMESRSFAMESSSFAEETIADAGIETVVFEDETTVMENASGDNDEEAFPVISPGSEEEMVESVSAGNPEPASGSEYLSDILEISGDIPEDMEVDPSVHTIILNGASAGADARIIIRSETTIVIEDGSVNDLYIIESDKDLQFTGGGELYLDFGIVGQNCNLLFNHTGTIRVSAGTISVLKGRIVFNSGNVSVTPGENIVSGIMAIDGDVEINGGEIQSGGEAGAIVAENDVNLNGGTLIPDSDTEPIVAGLHEGTGIHISDNFDADGLLRTETVTDGDRQAVVLGSESFIDADAETDIASETDLPLLSAPSDIENADKATEEFQEKIEASAEEIVLEDAVTAPSLPAPSLLGTPVPYDSTAQYGTFRYAPFISHGKDAEADYIYRDSDFLQPATKYNQKLAVMSINLAMSAFNSAEGGDDYSHRYANVENLLHNIGFTDFEVNSGYLIKPTATSIGVAIAHKEIKDSDGADRSVIAIAIRGAGYESEWSGNVHVGASGEHAGFAEARNQVISAFLEYMTKHGDRITEQPKLWIVGYSRASATANLTANFFDCAVDILNGTRTLEDTVPSTGRKEEERSLMTRLTTVMQTKNAQSYDDIYAYCFEVPQGAVEQANAGYPNHTNPCNIWCQANPEDPVPLVAPAYQWKFLRYGASMDPRTAGFTDGSYEVVADSIYHQGNNDRNQMLAQLALINPDVYKKVKSEPAYEIRTTGLYELLTMKFDWLHWINDEVTTTPLGGPTLKNLTDKEKFVDALVKEFIDEAGSRKKYDEKYDAAFRFLCELLMGASAEEKEVLMTEFGNAAGTRMTPELAVTIASLIVAAKKIPFMPSDTRAVAKLTIAAVAAAIVDDVAATGVTILDSEKAQILTGYLPDVVGLLYDFLINDYFDRNMETVGTALYLGASLINAHIPEVTLAYLRAHDPDYYMQSVDVVRNTLTFREPDAENAGKFRIIVRAAKNGFFEEVAEIQNGEMIRKDPDVDELHVSKGTDGSKSIVIGNLGEVYSYPVDLTFTLTEQTDADGVWNAGSIAFDCQRFVSGSGGSSVLDNDAWYEKREIPMVGEDRCVFTIAADGGIQFEKRICLKTRVTDQTFAELTDGTKLELNGVPGLTEFMATAATDQAEQKTVAIGFNRDVNPRDFFDIAKCKTGEHGKPLTDSNGNPLRDTSGNALFDEVRSYRQIVDYADGHDTPEPLSLNLDSVSTTYFARLFDHNKRTVVTADALLARTDGISSEAPAPLKKTLADRISVSIQNLTTGESVQAFRDESRSAEDYALFANAGDRIVATVHIPSDLQARYEFLEWSNFGTPLDPLTTQVTPFTKSFAMPAHDVDLQAVFHERSPVKNYLTFDGHIYDFTQDSYERIDGCTFIYDGGYPKSRDPRSGEPWEFRSGSDVVHCISMKDEATPEIFIEAPFYPSGSYQDLMFDHWEAWYSDTGEYLDLDPVVKIYNVDGELINLNGSMERNIRIVQDFRAGAPADITMVAVWKPAVYSAELIRGDGSREDLGTFAPGELVTLGGTAPDPARHQVFEAWEAACDRMVETVYSDIRCKQELIHEDPFNLKPYIASGSESWEELCFRMPKGNLTVTERIATSSYLLTVEDGYALPRSETGQYPYGTTVEILPNRYRDAEGNEICGWETTPSDLPVDTSSKDQFGRTRYLITMPAAEVTMSPVYRAPVKHRLTVQHGKGIYIDKNITLATISETDEVTVYDAIPEQGILITPQVPVGKVLTGWSSEGLESMDTQMFPGAIIHTKTSTATVSAVLADCKAGTVPAPEIKTGQPGTYHSDIKISLKNPGAEYVTYYMIDDTPEPGAGAGASAGTSGPTSEPSTGTPGLTSEPSAEEIIAANNRYDEEAMIELALPCRKTVYAVTVTEKDMVRTQDGAPAFLPKGSCSKVTSFAYELTPAEKKQYHLLVTDGTARYADSELPVATASDETTGGPTGGDETGGSQTGDNASAGNHYLVREGERIILHAEMTGKVGKGFAGWNLSGFAEIPEASRSETELLLTVPEASVSETEPPTTEPATSGPDISGPVAGILTAAAEFIELPEGILPAPAFSYEDGTVFSQNTRVAFATPAQYADDITILYIADIVEEPVAPGHRTVTDIFANGYDYASYAEMMGSTPGFRQAYRIQAIAANQNSIETEIETAQGSRKITLPQWTCSTVSTVVYYIDPDPVRYRLNVVNGSFHGTPQGVTPRGVVKKSENLYELEEYATAKILPRLLPNNAFTGWGARAYRRTENGETEASAIPVTFDPDTLKAEFVMPAANVVMTPVYERIPQGAIPAPTVTGDWPGRYPRPASLQFANAADIQVYYLLRESDDQPAAEEIISRGKLYTGQDVTIRGIYGMEREYHLYAVSVLQNRTTFTLGQKTYYIPEGSYSGVAEFRYEIDRTVQESPSVSKAAPGRPSYAVGRWEYNIAANVWYLYLKPSDDIGYKNSGIGNRTGIGYGNSGSKSAYGDTAEYKFTGGWIYAYNPYAKSGDHRADWFYFDDAGRMLTGWQLLLWNNQYSWFYLNPVSDASGTLGSCQLGGITPDGYTLHADGSWAGY